MSSGSTSGSSSSKALITITCESGVSTVVENLSYAVDDERYIAGYFSVADIPYFQPGNVLGHTVVVYSSSRLEMNEVKIHSMQVEVLTQDLVHGVQALHVYGFQGFLLKVGAHNIKEST